jgi:CobQ/CobB/MinD/ParA nucleotide binding domain
MATSLPDPGIPAVPVRFSDALARVREWTFTNQELLPKDTIFLRDLRGRFRVIVRGVPTLRQQFDDALASLHVALGAFSPGRESLCVNSEELFDANSFFSSQDLRPLSPDWPQSPYLLDREPQNGDWLRGGLDPIPDISLVTFYGVKGGVGRSTALALLAIRLAEQGRRVIVVDLDLESPGLTSVLSPPGALPPFGMVDWFVENGVGQADMSLAKDMMTKSPLGRDAGGEILLVPAFGENEHDYLGKLSRAYLDQPAADKTIDFASVLRDGLAALAHVSGASVMLLDSRAGLHDIAASAIVRLGAHTLLFAANSPQTWRSYRLLFEHWQSFPERLPQFRAYLKFVDALIPETGRADHRESFVENAYSLLSDTIYEKTGPGELAEFNYDVQAIDAPHWPLPVRWSRVFQEFDPLSNDSQVSHAEIEAAYGEFLQGVIDLLF